MRKISVSLSLLGITSTFSFHKMSERSFFKLTGMDVNNKAVFKKISRNDLTKKFNEGDYYYIYYYDNNLKYYLVYQSIMYEYGNSLWRMCGNHKFDSQWWKDHFDDKVKHPDLRFAYIYSPTLKSPSPEDFQKSIEKSEKDRNFSFNFVQPFFNISLSFDPYSLDIDNRQDGVILSSFLNSKEIDFQAALLKYMKSRKHQQDQLFEYSSNFIHDYKKSDIEPNNEFKTDSVSKIANASKTNYTQDQITLLENSKILTIWAVPEKEYTNKNDVESWNKRHPEAPKSVETKKINRIIIGYAYDQRDNTSYNWIIDLGQYISVLYDQAEAKK